MNRLIRSLFTPASRAFKSRRFRLTLPAFLWVFCAFFAVLSAKSILAQTGAKTAQIPSNLDQNAFEAEVLGLKLHLPVGASVIAQKVNGQLVLSISDDPTTPTWTMQVQTLTSTKPDPTAAGQIEELLRDFRGSNQRFEIISNTPFSTATSAGQLCFVKMTADPKQVYVSGWLLLPTSESTFLVFAMQTLPEHLPRVRPLLESSLATINLQSAADVAIQRQAVLDAGRAFIASATPDRLKSLVGVTQWVRIYTPAKADGTLPAELGYSLLEALEAKKGALEPAKSEKQYDANERKSGLMIRIQGRIVIDAERGVYYDSIALYWMAWDQSEEAWSIRGTHRQGEAEQSEAETAIRTPYLPGAGPPRLTVIKSDNTRNTREPYDWEVPEVYLSQPLNWLIGRLLPKNVREDHEYRYYAYNFTNRTAQVSMRSDVWGPMNDGSGHFRLITKMTTDSPAITTMYNAAGELIRRVHPEGTITEPTTVDAIQKLWKSKGLLVGATGK